MLPGDRLFPKMKNIHRESKGSYGARRGTNSREAKENFFQRKAQTLTLRMPVWEGYAPESWNVLWSPKYRGKYVIAVNEYMHNCMLEIPVIVDVKFQDVNELDVTQCFSER